MSRAKKRAAQKYREIEAAIKAIYHGDRTDAATFDERLTDLLTDLRHMAERKGIDFGHCDQMAASHYAKEGGERDRLEPKPAPTGKGTYRVYSRMKSVQSCEVEATSPEDASAQVEKLEESGDPWGKEFLEDSERYVVKLKRVRRYNVHTKKYYYNLDDPRD